MKITEHGSTPHLEWPLPDHRAAPLAPALACYGNGRQALWALIRHRGWNTVWVPTYFCHDVTRSLQNFCRVSLYEAAPFDDSVSLALGAGEAAIVMEYFGSPSGVRVIGGEVIVDRSHDPFSQHSYERTPDYCIASLRKTLPIPDGGAVWSEAGRPLPAHAGPGGAHTTAVLDLLTGQALKAAYLRGSSVDKHDYLALLASGEEQMTASNEVSAMSSWSHWVMTHENHADRALARARNIDAFHAAWQSPGGFQAVDTPAYVCLVAPNQTSRDDLRRRLIAQDVYPAVLWPLNEPGIPERHRSWSGRMMVLHADARYERSDMERVVSIVHEAVAQP